MLVIILIVAGLLVAAIKGYSLFGRNERLVECFYNSRDPRLPWAYFRCVTGRGGYGGGNTFHNDKWMAPGWPWPSFGRLILDRYRFAQALILSAVAWLLLKLALVQDTRQVFVLVSLVVLVVNFLYVPWVRAFSQTLAFPEDSPIPNLPKWRLWRMGLTDRGFRNRYYPLAFWFLPADMRADKCYAYNPWFFTWFYRVELLLADLLVVLVLCGVLQFVV